MSEPITELMNDAQWAEYLSDVLKRLDTHARQLPAETTLRKLIEAACGPLGCLIGYFAAGISGNSAEPDFR